MKNSPPLSPFRAYGPFCRAAFAFIVVAVLLGGAALHGQDRADESQDEAITPIGAIAGDEALKEKIAPPEFSEADLVAAQKFTETLGVADWLGPLAPVALSPFFGITCLSGMSLYGESWISADNAFLGKQSPLHNETIFWTFLALTVVTSIPRFTKVSKPFAQAVDRIEAWAGIITLLVLRIMISSETGDAEMPEVAVMQAGVFSFSTDLLLMIAGAINIFVINAVKFFFEVLIWLTPLPTVDAIFEVCNKTLCAVLMAIYGYSPTLATIINLGMFIVAALVFRWAYRRQVFFRTMLLDGALSFFSPKSALDPPELIVFPKAAVGEIPARAKCSLTKTEDGWMLEKRSLFGSSTSTPIASTDSSLVLDSGYFTNSLTFNGAMVAELTFSRRFNACLPAVAAAMAAKTSEVAEQPEKPCLKTEFA